MHAVLQRQMRKLGIDPASPPDAAGWQALLDRVAQTYAQADQDRYMLERSLAMSSREMQRLYDELARASQAELAKKSSELEKSLALARAIQESVEDAILVADVDRHVLSYNRRFVELWGFPDDVVAARDSRVMLDHVASLVASPDEFRARIEHLYANVDETGIDEVPLRDGRTLARFSGPVRGSDGGVRARVWCYRDVTAERRLAAERAVVAERMASVGQLVASVAHEINNPLAYVAGNVGLVFEQLVARGAEEDATLVEALDDVRVGVERIRVIVRDLRTLSRADEETRAPVDIHAVLDSALQMAKNQIRHRAQVERRFEPVPPVVANEARLAQVFLNLLVNAAQAIPEGRASENAVTVRTSTVGDNVRVEIRDTGAGIEPTHLERIFDPFFTTKPLGVGTGLGLSICKGIVDKLGGSIRVASAVGTGTTFTIDLPAARARPTRSREDDDAAPAPRPRRRVLVVDDDAHVRRWLSRALANDHDVTSVASVDDALAAVGSGPFDAILCDVMMPDRTGLDMHDAVRRQRPELAARIVFMSGGVFTPALQAFLEQAPNLRLDKPISLRDVRAAIERVAAA